VRAAPGGLGQEGGSVARPPTASPSALRSIPFRGSTAVAGGLVTRRMLAGPSWRRLFSDVYLHADTVLDHFSWCQAAALLLPSDGALSGQSAAFLFGADLLPIGGAPVQVTVPQGVALRSRSGLVIRRSALPEKDVWRRASLPVTSPVRSAFDLARHLDLVEAVVAVDALLYRRLVSLPALADFAASHKGWYGVRQVARVLDLAAVGVESPMETRLRVLLVLAGLPRPVVQPDVFDAAGRFVARLDLAYPELRIGLEYDGDHHRDRQTFQRDVARLNRLRLCGWTVLRFTADDVLRHPARVVAQVQALLAATRR
jgi:hypothetical protein